MLERWTDEGSVFFKVTSRLTTGDTYVAKPYKDGSGYQVFNHSVPSDDNAFWRADIFEENLVAGAWTVVDAE